MVPGLSLGLVHFVEAGVHGAGNSMDEVLTQLSKMVEGAIWEEGGREGGGGEGGEGGRKRKGGRGREGGREGGGSTVSLFGRVY